MSHSSITFRGLNGVKILFFGTEMKLEIFWMKKCAMAREMLIIDFMEKMSILKPLQQVNVGTERAN